MSACRRQLTVLLTLPARDWARRAQGDVVPLHEDDDSGIHSVEQGIFGVLFTVSRRRPTGKLYLVSRYAKCNSTRKYRAPQHGESQCAGPPRLTAASPVSGFARSCSLFFEWLQVFLLLVGAPVPCQG